MSIALRAALFLGLWLAIADGEGLFVGILAAGAATTASVRLQPPAAAPGDPVAVLKLVARVLCESGGAGLDITRRVFDPRLPLQPGLLRHAPRLPRGMARDAFTAVASLAPGALPAGTDSSGVIVIHALDTRMPVLRDLAVTETLLVRAARGDG